MSEIIHFPGQVMTFGSVARQRCMWCGALIEEKDLDRIAIEEASRPPERQGKPLEVDDLAWWRDLVAVDGNWKSIVEHPADGKAPERSCMRLMPQELESAA